MNGIVKIYYIVKPFLPRKVQINVRRSHARIKRRACNDNWPIDEKSALLPTHWQGWPEKKQFALVLTHDVEHARGQGKCINLMKTEEKLGFRSSFNFVPKRYRVSGSLRKHLVQRGFEVGIHGLYHDGKLFQSRKIFNKRSQTINGYLKEWKAEGFRAPAMHHNLEWISDLDITYDLSTFDTDPFQPQNDGVGTIFPFMVYDKKRNKSYVELPYTIPQDFSLFILLKEQDISIWKDKLDWIANRGGMALLNSHPDYMNFNGDRLAMEEYPAAFYAKFLEHVKIKYADQYWHALPKTVAEYCRMMIN